MYGGELKGGPNLAATSLIWGHIACPSSGCRLSRMRAPVCSLLCLLGFLVAADAVCPTVQYASGTRFSAAGFTAGQTITIGAGQVYLFDLANSPQYGVRRSLLDASLRN